jgi:Chromo (CHRromatin Organisation MOdifier) domain/Integrase zinc binding domain/Integrase core domain
LAVALVGVPGEDNIVADTLSRVFSHRGVVLADINDDEKAARLSSVHNEIVGHHGITRTVDILKAAKLEWSGLVKDVTKFINECLICQKIKTSRNLFKGDSEFHLHGLYPMESLSCDTIGPLPEDSFGNKYIIAIVDNFSKFVTLYATQSTQAQDFVRSLVEHVGLFGVPKNLRTDGGTQFTAKVCKELSQLLKYEHLVIVPYHPQANGLVERRNAEIMKHLRALVLSRHIVDSWSSVLPLVQRILNFSKDGSINLCPAQVIFGDMIPMDVSIIVTSSDGTVQTSEYLETLRMNQLRLIQASQKYLEENAVIREGKGNVITDYENFDIGDYVLLSYPSRPPSKLAGLYRGPLVIHRRNRKDIYEVRDLITDKVSEVHISRIHALQVPPEATEQDILRLAGLDHDEYVVETIVDHRKTGTRKTDWEFLVRWKGYEPSEDTWEPFSNVKELAALDLYLESHPDLQID